MSKPLLSVCLITYNQAQYIKEALESILIQKVNFTWELVIADDYSTDGTREILLEYKKKFPDLIKLILQQKNVGAERNWLDLMTYPKSKYVAYIEGDDYWTDPNKLQVQVDFLEKNPSHILCFHPAKIFFENGEEKQTIWPNLKYKTKLTTNELLKENFIPSNSVVYRRQKYDELPTGTMPGDWYLHLYHAQFGKIGVINRVMSSYRRHSGGMWWESFNDKDALWKKYGLAHVTLYVELLKIYGKDEEKRKIIYKGLSDALANLVSVDKRFGDQSLKTALKKFPDVVEPFIVSQYETIDEQRQLNERDKQEIQRLNDDIIGLRGDLFRVRDELHTIKNSRIVGRIIKLRDHVGSIYTLPWRVLNKLRRIVARYIPDRIRLPLMKFLRSVRSRLKHELHRAQEAAAEVVIVRNEHWNKSRPLVSVVIPYYNRADTIDDTLESLRAQTFQDFETIIVDDGSTDPKSITKLKKLLKTYPQVKFMNQQNQGVATTRNNGIKEAKGKYVICLDSDDMLDPTFIEKATVTLETNPDIALVTTYQDMFGVINDLSEKHPYDPIRLIDDNMVITASQFRKEAWEISGGYKSNIGYEDWDFWLTLAENGFWGKLIAEPLFKYRTSMQSRYVEDKDVHWNNIKVIRGLHPNYKSKVRALISKRRRTRHVVDSETAFINVSDKTTFTSLQNEKPNVLITVPWMDFGGVSTLLNNFTHEVTDDVNLHFITGLANKNEWEYKFKKITPRVYHMPNMLDEDPTYQLEFMSNYIATRSIDILHIVHNGFVYSSLEELRRRHPHLRVVVTVFNDRAPYLSQSIEQAKYIDLFTTDNLAVGEIYKEAFGSDKNVRVIPNGININTDFNPALFDRAKLRHDLKIEPGEIAIFYIGRLSEEKNPDLYVEAVQALVDRGVKNAKYFMIGDGPMSNEVQKAVYDIKDRPITYLGYQSNIAEFLAAADVFVLPSAVEGFPLSILEAMAMKVAVVATNVGAVSDVIVPSQNGIITDDITSESIAQSIEKLVNDRKLLELIKLQTRVDVEDKYSNAILGRNYRKLYKELST